MCKSTQVLGLGEIAKTFKGGGSVAEMLNNPRAFVHLCCRSGLVDEHLYSYWSNSKARGGAGGVYGMTIISRWLRALWTVVTGKSVLMRLIRIKYMIMGWWYSFLNGPRKSYPCLVDGHRLRKPWWTVERAGTSSQGTTNRKGMWRMRTGLLRLLCIGSGKTLWVCSRNCITYQTFSLRWLKENLLTRNSAVGGRLYGSRPWSVPIQVRIIPISALVNWKKLSIVERKQ